jgi:hypothetical protein
MRWTAAFILLTVPTLATAQETYTLKLPSQAKGDIRRVGFDMQQSIGVLRLDTFGSELGNRTSQSSSKLAYVDEIRDALNGQVTHYRRRFETATQTVNDANPAFLAIHGKSVVVDRRQGTPQLTWEDGKPASDGITGPMEDALKEGKDNLGAMSSFEPLPSRPVKVGESWNVDITAIVKDCEAKHGCKLTGATGVGTLKEVYKGANGSCAKVEVHIRVPLRTINNGDHSMDLAEGSGTALDAAYDFGLDGKDSYYASAMQMKFLATGSNPEGDGTQSRVRIELGIELREQRNSGR